MILFPIIKLIPFFKKYCELTLSILWGNILASPKFLVVLPEHREYTMYIKYLF